MPDLTCSVCGAKTFSSIAVMWPALISAWQLSEAERQYVDRQQGCCCTRCGANLRAIALANQIRAAIGTGQTLRDAIEAGLLDDHRILDCNGVPTVSGDLAKLPGLVRADFPEFDMCRLPFADDSFDFIVHSDTLEHIERPLLALEECRRVLAPGGRLCFTIPLIVGRLTRSRAGLPLSHHGNSESASDDLIVHSEFGADAWTILFEAGFTDISMSQVDFPSAIAFMAWCTADPVTSD